MHVHDVISACVCSGAQRTGDRAARKGKTDQGDRRADDCGGHDLIDPLDPRELDGDCDDDIHKSCEQGADQKSEISERHGRRSRKRRRHRSDEGERTAEEYRALEFGKELIDERARACAEERRRDGHIASRHAVDGDRDCDGRRKNGEQLLQREQNDLPGLGSVFDTVDEFHWYDLSLFNAFHVLYHAPPPIARQCEIFVSEILSFCRYTNTNGGQAAPFRRCAGTVSKTSDRRQSGATQTPFPTRPTSANQAQRKHRSQRVRYAVKFTSGKRRSGRGRKNRPCKTDGR